MNMERNANDELVEINSTHIKYIIYVIIGLILVKWLAVDSAVGGTSSPVVQESYMSVDAVPVKVLPPEPVPVYIDTEETKDKLITNDHPLWLARVAWSETKDIDQAEYIMEVVINRWRTDYRDETTLWGTIHSFAQFSAWLDPEKRKVYGSLTRETDNELWMQFIYLAEEVIFDGEHTLPAECRHFHHGWADPSWGGEPTYTIPYYTGVDSLRLEIHCDVD